VKAPKVQKTLRVPKKPEAVEIDVARGPMIAKAPRVPKKLKAVEIGVARGLQIPKAPRVPKKPRALRVPTLPRALEAVTIAKSEEFECSFCDTVATVEDFAETICQYSEIWLCIERARVI